MKRHPSIILILTILLASVLLFSQSASSQEPAHTPPQTPEATTLLAPTAPSNLLFSYQGQLLDAAGDPITNPALPITFSLFTTESGGTACWNEAHTVDVQDGLFNVLLGQTTAINADACLLGDAYLELTVDGETLSPRELLASVAHAVEADGISGDLDMKEHNIINGGYIELNKPIRMETTHFVSGQGHVVLNKFDLDGTSFWFRKVENMYDVEPYTTLMTIDNDGDVGTTGDINADGMIYSDGGVVGARNPTNGTASVNLSWLNDVARIRIGGDGAGAANGLDIQAVGNRSLMRIDNSGNVGIGTTNPSKKLDVNGDVRIDGLNLFMRGTSSQNVALRLADSKLYVAPWGGDGHIIENVWIGGGNTVGLHITGDLSIGGTCLTSAQTDTADGITLASADDCPGGSIISGAYVEANLQTESELSAGKIDRFEEGDVLCWGIDQLELCAAANDRLVQAVADANGRPIIMGAEVVKVVGPVRRGDILVSSDVPGYAMVNNNPEPGAVIAQALEDFDPTANNLEYTISLDNGRDSEKGIIKAMIRKW